MPRPSLSWLALAAVLLAGCGAVFPEVSTRFSEAPLVGTFDPPPPQDRHYLKVVSAVVPAKTRDGREWDQVFGSLPDPYVKVFVNDKEIFRTIAASDTLTPTFESSPAGNFALAIGDKLEVQLWDSSPMNDSPIGVREVSVSPDMIDGEDVELDLGGGAKVNVLLKPAKPVWGVGLWFELRNDSTYVTRLIDGSPASRADVQAGDRILKIDDKAVDGLSVDEVRSLLSAIPAAGRALVLQHKDGATLQITLKEGPIYPLFSDYEKLPITPK